MDFWSRPPKKVPTLAPPLPEQNDLIHITSWWTAEMSKQNPIPLPHLDRLRQLLSTRRGNLGLTYDDLAEMSGVSRRTIIAVETGTSPGSMETWFRLANALAVGFDDLFIAATGLTTDINHDSDTPTPTMMVRPGVDLSPHSDLPGAIYPDGTRPDREGHPDSLPAQ